MKQIKKIPKRKLCRVGSGTHSSFYVVIPKRYIVKLGWTRGKKLDLKLSGRHVTLWMDDDKK